MPRSALWRQDVIRELLVLAETSGRSEAKLASRMDAENFRFAVYNFRTRHDCGHNITLTLDGSSVVFTHKPKPAVEIAQEEPAHGDF